MTELLQMIINNQTKFVRDFLNNEISEELLADKFDLKKCDKCVLWNLENDTEEIDEKIVCESCKNDY